MPGDIPPVAMIRRSCESWHAANRAQVIPIERAYESLEVSV